MKGSKPKHVTPGRVTEAPRAPAWLSKDAKAEWRRVAPLLVQKRALDQRDLSFLASYCQAQGLVQTCQRTIAAEGEFFTGASGPKRHPAVAAQNEALRTARQFAAELTLTPVSRTRLEGADADEDGGDPDLGL